MGAAASNTPRPSSFPSAPTRIPLAGNPAFIDRMSQQQQEAAKVSNTNKGATQIPAPNNPDYYTPDQLQKDYERANPGKSFNAFLSDAESKYGPMPAVRSGLSAASRSPFVGRSSLFGR